MSRFVDVCRFALSNIGSFPKKQSSNRENSQNFLNVMHNKMNTTLYNLKEYLKREGISVVQLSKNTGIPQDRIYSWLRGKGNPKAEDVRTLEGLWGIGTNPNEPDTKKPTEKAGEVEPGMYQEVLRALIKAQDELIESGKAQRRLSDAQIKISEALLEERQLMKDTAQRVMDLAARVPAGDIAANLANTERIAHDNEVAIVSLREYVTQKVSDHYGIPYEDVREEINNVTIEVGEGRKKGKRAHVSK